MGVLLFGMRLRVVAMVKGSLGILGGLFEGVLIHTYRRREMPLGAQPAKLRELTVPPALGCMVLCTTVGRFSGRGLGAVARVD